MIISASRRTDIPAFYAEWFIRRIRAGYCVVPNPFNPGQIARVSLKPEDVDVIVFWTRNPRPLFPYLAELDERGFRYYFQYTLLDYPAVIDPKMLPIDATIKTFQDLADRIGPPKVIWRYDPIVFTTERGLAFTGAVFHQEAYARIAQALNGYTHRSVISLLDIYPKAKKRLNELAQQGVEIITENLQEQDWFGVLMSNLVEIAVDHGMEINSCAEMVDLLPYGIHPGKCVDDAYIKQVFGMDVSHKKDTSQRAACGCVVSKDIGIYNTCLFACRYCYATDNLARAQARHARHDPDSPMLVG